MPSLPLAESLVTLVLLLGLVGCVMPFVPGLPVMWLALFVYDLFDWSQNGFDAGDLPLLILAGVVVVVAMFADMWLGGAAARKAGASKRSIFFGLAGGLLLLLIAPFTGGISILAAMFAPVVIIAALEFREHQDQERSLRAGLGFAIGAALAAGVRLIAGVAVFGIWLWQLRSILGA